LLNGKIIELTRLVSAIPAVAQQGSKKTSGTVSAQPRAAVDPTLDSTVSKNQSDNPVKWQALLWAAYTEPRELFVASDLRAAVINVPSGLHNYNRSGPLHWTATGVCSILSNLLGREFICFNRSTIDVHQSVVTVKCIEQITTSEVSVSLQPWDTLAEELRRLQGCEYDLSALPLWFAKPKNTILFIQPTAIEAVNRRQLASMYKAIRILQPGYGAQLRAYPNEIEVEKEHYKLGDIEALDCIADKAREWRYQYRPRTCFRPGQCILAEFARSVHKRTNSDCAKHVKVRPREEHDGLMCELPYTEQPQGDAHGKAQASRRPASVKPSSKTEDNGERWFHQEYIAPLANFEYRVFIVAEPEEDSLRGRSRRILKVLRTTPESFRDTSNKNILAHEQTPKNCVDYNSVVEFALYIFDELRRLPGAELEFESLDVGGVRLDIAISVRDESTKRLRFFVNEITRWHSAYYFSRWACPSPYTEICEAYATAFSNYFFPDKLYSPPNISRVA
jgi:hypothetical protein